MIPTHKDLVTKHWKQYLRAGINLNNQCWRYFGYNGRVLGYISLNFGRVTITASLGGDNNSHVQVPLKNGVFNYQDYIPEWEQCMDRLLATIFK